LDSHGSSSAEKWTSVSPAGGLQGDVGGAHAQRLAGRVRQREDVIGGDAVLLGSRAVEVGRTAADGDDELVRRDGLLLAVLLGGGDGVRVREAEAYTRPLFGST